MTTADCSHSELRTTSPGRSLLNELDKRLDRDVERFLSSNVWSVLSSRSTPTRTVTAILRELYWEIYSYQEHTTKAGFHMIGGASVSDDKIMKTLLLHKWDEVEHRQWAWECYLALGGEPARAAVERMSPGSFAVAAVWERLATHLHALSYVGAEYLFEALTARLAPIVVEALHERDIRSDGLRFITEHATEDQKHKNLFEHLIVQIGDAYPRLHEEVLYCYDCFNSVYPMPIWEACVARGEAHP